MRFLNRVFLYPTELALILAGILTLIVLIATAGCVTPGQASSYADKVDRLASKVDQVASVAQTAAATTAAAPGLGTIVGGAATVATAIAVALHSLAGVLRRRTEVNGSAGPAALPGSS